MENLGLLAILHAKPEKSETVASFIKGAIDLARQEDETLSWYSFRIDDNTFGIFDTFKDDNGRDAHLKGEIAKALMSQAEELLSKPPEIKPVEILSAK